MNRAASWHTETFIQLAGYREVEEVLRRGKDFVVSGTKAESDEFVHGTIIAVDGREHLARRRALMRMISPDQPWGPEGQLLDEVFEHNLNRIRATIPAVRGARRFDLIEFCRRVIWRVTAAFVGIDGIDSDERVSRFLELARPVLDGLTVEYKPADQRDELVRKSRVARERIRTEMFLPSLNRRAALLKQIFEEGRSPEELPADLLTSMLRNGRDAGPDVELIFREAVALLAAAVNNPVSQAAWALDDLLPWLQAHPEHRAHVAEREFLNLAVKETLRLHRSSRPHLVRIAARDVVLESSGRRIPAGSWVSSRLGAANRDEGVFGPDADTYDPYRTVADPKVQPFGIAFGAGPHVCLGRPMLLWEQGGEHAQGIQTKLLRLLLGNDVRKDPDGVHELTGEEGGRRYTRYDVIMPDEEC
jgi:cytochrome P450